MTRALLAAALLAGCLESQAIVCKTGRVCPEGTVCDDTHDLCVLEEQLHACDDPDLPDGTVCDIAREPVGFCLDGDCLRQRCGDGRVTNNERCDPADDDTDTSTCDAEGFYVGGEVACTDECRYEVGLCSGFCGDEHVDVEELCDGDVPDSSCVDFGFDGGGLACNGLCGGDTSGCRLVGWKRFAVPTDDELHQLHGTARDDVWVLTGSGALFHDDGTGFVLSEAPKLMTHVWAAARDDVYASGQCLADVDGCGRLYHFDGDRWKRITLPQLPGQKSGGGIVWGTGPDNVYWFAEGVVWRGHGEDPDDWSEVKALGGVERPEDAWGSSADDVYLASSVSGLYHRTGDGWEAEKDAPLVDPYAVWGSGPDDVWVGSEASGLFHWDGEEWSDGGLVDVNVHSIWGTARDHVFALDTRDHFMHFDGTSWRTLDRAPFQRPFFDVWGAAADHVLVAGMPGFLGRYHDGLWWNTIYPESISTTVDAIDAASPEEIWVLSEEAGGVNPQWNLSWWNGSTWEVVDNGFTTNFAKDVWRAGPGVAFVVGGDGAENLRRVVVGGVVTKDAAGYPMLAVGGTSFDMVIAVGTGGVILEYDGNDDFDWTIERAQDPVGPDLNDVWVHASGEAFAVGADGEVVRRTPAGLWADEETEVAADLRAVWGRAVDDVYAVGEGGVILHRDGGGWTQIADLGVELTDVTGTDDGELFVVAAAGAAFHWDGDRWLPLRIAADLTTLRAVHAVDNLVLFGGGPPFGVLQRLARHTSWLLAD